MPNDLDTQAYSLYSIFFTALFDMSRETDVAVTLYSKKVMVLAKANHVLPRWLRFIRGKSENITQKDK